MNPEYVKDVHRYGSARLRDAEGKPLNISHAEDCDPTQVRTDGRGNVLHSPLIWRKDCWGRPERFVRGHTSARQWWDKSGEQRLSKTPCDRCKESSPGAYEACGAVVDERVRSNSAIDAALEAWLTACGNDSGPRCFTGRQAKLWQAVLQAIVDHGGWTNVNDEQVKLEALRRAAVNRQKRNATARDCRKRQRKARKGSSKNITAAYLQALQDERDRRAASVKSLRALTGRTSRDMLWLKNLPDTSCDRIADVWWSREQLSHSGQRVTGRAIANHMINNGRDYGLQLPSLITRVHDDIKRIAKFEDNLAGEPIWKAWTYSD